MARLATCRASAGFLRAAEQWLQSHPVCGMPPSWAMPRTTMRGAVGGAAARARAANNASARSFMWLFSHRSPPEPSPLPLSRPLPPSLTGRGERPSKPTPEGPSPSSPGEGGWEGTGEEGRGDEGLLAPLPRMPPPSNLRALLPRAHHAERPRAGPELASSGALGLRGVFEGRHDHHLVGERPVEDAGPVLVRGPEGEQREVDARDADHVQGVPLVQVLHPLEGLGARREDHPAL